MKRIYDSNFDPLRDLETMARNQETMSKNLMEIAKSLNSKQDIIEQIVQHVNLHAGMIQQLEERIQQLENK